MVLIFGLLPFDPIFEVILFSVCIIMLVPIVTLFIMNVIRSRRFGYIFPPPLTGLVLNPSQTANVLNLESTKDTVETKDQDKIFHAHERTIYAHAKSGVKFCFIEPISDFAQNGELVDYIMKLKNGDNVLGPNNTPLRFNSLNEARLYFYEHIFLAELKLNKQFTQEWKDQEMIKVKQAKGLIKGQKEITRDEISTSTDGTTTQTREKEVIPLEPMSQAEFEDFMKSIQERAIQYHTDIFPISYDGHTLSFNGLESWMSSPSPENTLDEQYMRGYRKGQREASRSSTDFLKIAFAFLIIALAAAFLFTKV